MRPRNGPSFGQACQAGEAPQEGQAEEEVMGWLMLAEYAPLLIVVSALWWLLV